MVKYYMALIKHHDKKKKKETKEKKENTAAAPVKDEIKLVQQFPGKLTPLLLALKNPE